MRKYLVGITVLTLLLGLTLATNSVFAQIDSDRDGYSDDQESASNFDPYSPCGKNVYDVAVIFNYDKGRLIDRTDEACRARFLKAELERILGKGNIKIHAKNWHTVVNAFIYGGYSPEEIAAVIKVGAKTVHPKIPRSAWKNSADYLKTFPSTDIADRGSPEIGPTDPTVETRKRSAQPIVVESKRELVIDPKTSVYGFVYDQFTKQALGNTEIDLYQYLDANKISAQFLFKTITDNSGFYQIIPGARVNAGQDLLVRVTRKLYTSAEYRFTYNPDVVSQVDFRLANRRGNETDLDELTNDPGVDQPKNPGLLTVVVKNDDEDENPVYNIRVKAEFTPDNAKKITLDQGTVLTNVTGKALFTGILAEGVNRVSGTVTVEHILLDDEVEEKEYKVNFQRDNLKEQVIEVELEAPEAVHLKKISAWQKELVFAKQTYTSLDDPRNENEILITAVDENSGREIIGFSIHDIETFVVNDSQGEAEIENVEEDLYFGNIRKTNASGDGYEINRYFVLNVLPNKRTEATIFLDLSQKQTDYTSSLRTR